MDRLRALQILRFGAALAVAQCHAVSILHGHRTAGFAGVDVFFVISGYIVTRSALTHPDNFLLKRAFRVLPLYYVAAAPYLWFGVTHGASRADILATVTLWPVYDRVTIPLLTVGWSLQYEMLFYVAVALAIAGLRPFALLLAYAGCAILRPVTGLPLFDFLGSPLILEFLAGVALAISPTACRPLLGGGAIVVAFIAFAFAAAPGVANIDSPLRVLLFGPPAALLVWGALQVERVLPDRLCRPFVFLGDASYSLYLTHASTMLLAKQLGVAVDFVLIAVAIAGAVGVYLGLERPWLRRCRGLLAVASRIPSTSTPAKRSSATSVAPAPDGPNS